MLVILLNPYPRAPTCPSTPKVLRVRERIPIPFSFVIFTFGLAFEFYEEFGSVSPNLVHSAQEKNVKN
jgi:hypothetical protein